jgi:hypothetical protein
MNFNISQPQKAQKIFNSLEQVGLKTVAPFVVNNFSTLKSKKLYSSKLLK